jgi:hypothetical protein
MLKSANQMLGTEITIRNWDASLLSYNNQNSPRKRELSTITL